METPLRAKSIFRPDLVRQIPRVSKPLKVTSVVHTQRRENKDVADSVNNDELETVASVTGGGESSDFESGADLSGSVDESGSESGDESMSVSESEEAESESESGSGSEVESESESEDGDAEYVPKPKPKPKSKPPNSETEVQSAHIRDYAGRDAVKRQPRSSFFSIHQLATRFLRERPKKRGGRTIMRVRPMTIHGRSNGEYLRAMKDVYSRLVTPRITALINVAASARSRRPGSTRSTGAPTYRLLTITKRCMTAVNEIRGFSSVHTSAFAKKRKRATPLLDPTR